MPLKKASKYFNSKENNDINDFTPTPDSVIVTDTATTSITENHTVWHNPSYKTCNNDKRNIDWFYTSLKKAGRKCIMCDTCLQRSFCDVLFIHFR